MDDKDAGCAYCGEPYHGRCTRCHRPGVPYEYRGQMFSGLIPRKGERLCRACADQAHEDEGVDILVIDDRISIPPYVYNTVRDRDLAQIWIPPELRGIDGRDAHGRHKRRAGQRRGR